MNKYRLFLSIILVLFVVSFITPAAAQEWSKEQQEVWSNVETYWSLAAKNDMTGFLGYFDPSFIGWHNTSDAPETKPQRQKVMEYMFANNQNVLYTITPAAIWVKGNFAFVHYYYTSLDKDKDGKEKWESGRWTDILMKSGNKWVMIGDHGGSDSDED
jgi:ketosteroid isomerase-like protein